MFARSVTRRAGGLRSVGRRRFTSIKELHAEALAINASKKKEEELAWRRKRNVPGLVVPEALKIRAQDSIELRKWKYEQQLRYELESKFDYVRDSMVSEGMISGPSVASRRAALRALRDWRPPLTGRQVSVEQLQAIQDKFLEETELKIHPGDSVETRASKAEKQLEHYIQLSKKALDAMGEPDEEFKEMRDSLKEMKGIADDPDAMELQVMEAEEELKDFELPEGINTMRDFTQHIAKMQKEILSMPQSAAQSVKAEPLEKLGLIRSHVLKDLDAEMARAQELEVKLAEEFATRFGSLPESVEGPVPSFETHSGKGAPLDLNEWKHLEKLDYRQFEKAPTELEVQIMDRFARKDEVFDAELNNVTLHRRIPVPAGPYDKGPFTRALHLFRLQAVRDYLHEMRKKRSDAKEFEYRDLDDLGLVMDDPEFPWKNEIFEEHKLALRNNHYWTQGQKERYLKQLHSFLRSDTFSKEEIDAGLV